MISNNRLEISQSAWQNMKEDAEARFPNECCGFFYGSNGDPKKVSEVVVIENSKEGDQKRRFEISAEDYMKGELYAAKNNVSLLGVYHSHPNHPAKPSEHDRIQAVPVFSYIIISVMNGKSEDITSWQLNDDFQFEQEELTLNKK